MFLDTVNTCAQVAVRPSQPSVTLPPFARWAQFPHSCISHHNAACCDRAKAWFTAMDFSLLGTASPLTGPRWVRARWDWGPSAHPVFWCEAVRAKKLDCGALAALAYEAFLSRGLQSFPLQLVQQFNADAAAHWRDVWLEKDVDTHWITDDGIFYHEGCAVQCPDGNIRLWDATDAWWIGESQNGGYGSVVALRLHASEAAPGVAFRWGARMITANEWMLLSADIPEGNPETMRQLSG